MDLTDVQNEGIVLSFCYHFSVAAYEHACNLKAFSPRRDGEVFPAGNLPAGNIAMFFGCPVRGEKNGIGYKERQLVGVLYIPLVPPEARAVFHFAHASFMKTAAKLCSSLRSF